MNQLRSALTPMRAWMLAVLLLAAQAAGLAHRVSHPQQPAKVTTAAAAAQVAVQVAAQVAAQAPQAAIGSDHKAGSADCRLIDQLMHADALCVAALLLQAPTLPHADGPAPRAQGPRAAAAALYRARAPPLG